jgi:hypothetical protein
MNDKHQENGALTGPLIFTLPASSFVVVLSFNWLDGTDRAVGAPKKRGWNYLTIRPRNSQAGWIGEHFKARLHRASFIAYDFCCQANLEVNHDPGGWCDWLAGNAHLRAIES